MRISKRLKLVKINRTHCKSLFVFENHIPAVPAGSSGDKAYPKIRREAKLPGGALDMVCSRKGLLQWVHITTNTCKMLRKIKGPARMTRHLFVALVYALTAIVPNLVGVERVDAALSTVEQSGFRFIGNVDAQDPRTMTVNHTVNNDTLGASAIDTINGFMYTAGHSTEWIIEKRSLLDGALVSGFGTGGRINYDIPSSNTEGINSIEIDLSDGSFFVSGWDTTQGASNRQWRIEKRNLSDGALVTGFGTSGVVTSNPTTGDDEPRAAIVDSTTGYIIIGGHQATNGGSWRIEKRSTSSGNLDTNFATGGVFTFSTSGRFESIAALAIDTGAGFYYLSGGIESTGNVGWRIEKRRINSNALCTAAECGTEFGTGGVFSHNPSSGTDTATTIKVDIAGDALYFGGIDNNNSGQWRVVKVTAASGTLVNAFGTNGVVTSNPGAGYNEIRQIQLDGVSGFLYFMGTQTATGSTGWRVEKRLRSDGSLVTGWGSSGSISVVPSSNEDVPRGLLLDIDRHILYIVGEDRTLGASNSQWRYELYQTDTGGRWYAAQDTVAIASTKVSFRLRMLLHISVNDLLVSDARQFKLQYAFKVGTCDTGFIGEVWSDVGNSSGEIQFHNNPSTADGQAMLGISGDPVHSGHTNVLQTIEESNNFTASTDVPVGQDGMWDFVLKDFEAFGAYCFRAVNSDGSLLDTYSIIPEMSFCRDDPRAENVMRHGTYFCEGTKRSFFWAKESI